MEQLKAVMYARALQSGRQLTVPSTLETKVKEVCPCPACSHSRPFADPLPSLSSPLLSPPLALSTSTSFLLWSPVRCTALYLRPRSLGRRPRPQLRTRSYRRLEHGMGVIQNFAVVLSSTYYAYVVHTLLELEGRDELH